MNKRSEGGRHEDEVVARLEQFKHTPVYFASGSERKAHILRNSGIFSEVFLVSAPGAVDREPFDHQRFLDTYEDDFFAHFKTEAPSAVAKGKLESIIEAGQVSDDVFLLAADTMPQFFPDTDEPGNDLNKPMEAISMERPKTIEEAKRQMLYVFKSIIRDYVDFRNLLHFQAEDMIRRDQPEDKIKRTLDIMWCGRLSSCVKVNTGIAIRFPQAKNISTFSEEINIYPQALYDIVEQELDGDYGALSEDNDVRIEAPIQKTEDLVAKKIDELIALQGEKVLQVSGGIDYSDPKVRACLSARVSRNARFIPEDRIDPKWFQGVPTQTIEEYIRRVAESE